MHSLCTGQGLRSGILELDVISAPKMIMTSYYVGVLLRCSSCRDRRSVWVTHFGSVWKRLELGYQT